MAKKRPRATTVAATAGGALLVGAAGVGIAVSRSGRKTTKAASAPSTPKEAKPKSAKGGRGTKAAKTVARGVGLVVLPAVLTTVDLMRNRKQIGAAAHQHMKALKAGDAGAKAGALKAAGKALMPLSTYILPVIAGAVSISTARDVYRKRGRVDEAVSEGAYAAADLVLGNALSEYSKQRATGEGRASSVAIATLKGLDNRILFGMAQRAFMSGQAAAAGKADVALSDAPLPQSDVPFSQMTVAQDQTTMRIVEHEAGIQRESTNIEDRRALAMPRDHVAAAFERRTQESAKTDRIVRAYQAGDINRANAEADRPASRKDMPQGLVDRGMMDLSRLSRPSTATNRLNAGQRKEFAAKNVDYTKKVSTSRAAGGAAASGARGWANPAVQKAAQMARGVDNVSDWAEDAEVKSP